VTASADGNSRVYNTMTGACHAILTGHEGEISKVAFNPQGSRILTASSDKTARIWETETGDCLQVRFYILSPCCASPQYLFSRTDLPKSCLLEGM
jgi:WD40 repeat protein